MFPRASGLTGAPLNTGTPLTEHWACAAGTHARQARLKTNKGRLCRNVTWVSGPILVYPSNDACYLTIRVIYRISGGGGGAVPQLGSELLARDCHLSTSTSIHQRPFLSPFRFS